MVIHKSPIFYLLVFLACLGLLAAGFHSALQGNSLGADFFTFWKAARAEFSEGRNPYDPAIAREIQVAIQGRLSEVDEDQFAYSYPIFGLLLVAPLAFLPFDWAQAVWLAFNFLLVLAAGLLLAPRNRRWVGVTFWIFYPVSFALILGNFDLLLAVIWLVFFARTLFQNKTNPGNSWWAGALLAITTLKPQFSWFFLILMAFLAVKRRNWILLGGFAAGSALLWLLPFLWHPGWFSEWLNQIVQYLSVNAGNASPVNVLFARLPENTAMILRWVGIITLVILSALLFLRTWQKRISGLHLLAWCGIVTYLVHPTGMSYEQMTVLIPIFLWAIHESRTRHALLVWVGFILLSWLSLVATLSKFDLLAASSWLLIAALAWLVWLFSRRNAGVSVKV
jgi:hypothetical protein